jgi:hypothetical protein
MWIKLRVYQPGVKLKAPTKIDVVNPHLYFLSDVFTDIISRKMKIPKKILKTNYSLIYQENGMGDMKGVQVKPVDTFFSLRLLDGASFLLLDEEYLSLYGS